MKLLLTVFTLLISIVANTTPIKPENTNTSIFDNEYLKGIIVTTKDQEWKNKWDTAYENRPNFTLNESISGNEEMNILVFVINPKLDENRMADLTCSVTISNPNKKILLEQNDIPCLKARIDSDPRSVFLALSAKYIPELDDVLGEITIDVMIFDHNKEFAIELQTTFLQK